ncbi:MULTISPECIES: hypothetical protein [Micrococcaceae]|uniref:hypothetical protein n=1 Tax=Micrococcaceae TaxID=1268 RepID=UPI00111455A2|nr:MULTISPECIES: hypothetical protein [Micrococcaceae]MDQ0092946.1 hypothetical protein [Paeniglutamicibacter psychrophenolicus]
MKSKYEKSGGFDFSRRLPSGSTIRELIERRDTLMKLIEEGKADPISDSQRASAARIRMAYDKKRGVKTQQWIVDLAKSA